MAGMGRFELPTNWFVARYSIQLSYIPAFIVLDSRLAALLRKFQALAYVLICFEFSIYSRLATPKSTSIKVYCKQSVLLLGRVFTLNVYLSKRMKICGGDGKIRTPDQLVRSQVLYPTELHPRRYQCLIKVLADLMKICVATSVTARGCICSTLSKVKQFLKKNFLKN